MSVNPKRRHLTREQGRLLVDSWEGGGQSQAAFCRANGIDDRKWSYWRSVTRSRLPTSVGFVQVKPTAVSRCQRLEVHLRDGVHIPIDAGFDPVVLRAVVEALS